MAVLPHLVGIAGPSCAGKGEIASFLSRHLAAPVLDLDAYYLDQSGLPFEERVRMNYDVPEALEYPLLLRQVQALARGEAIPKPLYSFERHTRTGQTTAFAPGRFVVLEGLFVLHWPELRSLLHTKVFVDACDEVCLARRVARDTSQRGRLASDVERQFRAQVQPAAIEFVRPTARWADVFLNGEDTIEANGARVLERLGAAATTMD